VNVGARDLARFSIEAPRYTSYPTAADFSPAVDGPAYAAALAESAPAALLLYVHLPFCHAICHFCGCHALAARSPERLERYVSTLAVELERVARVLGGAAPVSELHFGGGSPSLLPPDDFERLLTALRAAFPFAADAQISLEADPRTTDLPKLRRWRDLGVRRLSFGFQDLDAKVQAAIGRNQSAAVSKTVFALARAVGFEGLNVDLCYGLPEQTDETFQRTIAEVAELGPDRVAIFGYAHVPWMKPAQRRLPIAALPGPEARLRLMADARAALVAAGYRAIGLDHFARPEDALARAADAGTLHRNFQGYTTAATDALVGLGLSAISELPSGFFQNARELGDYQRAIAAGGFATERGVLRSAEDVVRGEIIKSLMCAFELDVDALERRHGVAFDDAFEDELAELRALADEGLVAFEGRRVRLTPLGAVFARNVARVFDAYRRRAPAAGGPRFSTTS
jgi:oxygen-independent coproporphyrinogen-3 oxidase